MAAGKSDKKSLRPRSTAPAEWVAAALGAIVVVLMIGSLIWYGLHHGDGTPDVTVRPDGAAQPVSGGYAVAFIARNAGSATAGQLGIKGELLIGGQVVEESTSTIDYLPGHSERKGGLYFRRDPGTGELTIYPTGYEKP